MVFFDTKYLTIFLSPPINSSTTATPLSPGLSILIRHSLWDLL